MQLALETTLMKTDLLKICCWRVYIADGRAEGLQYVHSDHPALGLAQGWYDIARLGTIGISLIPSSLAWYEQPWCAQMECKTLWLLPHYPHAMHKVQFHTRRGIQLHKCCQVPTDIYSFGVIIVEINTDLLLPILKGIAQRREMWFVDCSCVCRDGG